ncbi:MAG: type II secretion system secretin GspD, partial [Rhodanobacter sp.]|nr:type II secretion system secretin GspD [Rhodanobacter sp.]
MHKSITLLIVLGIALLAGCSTPASKRSSSSAANNSDILTADNILKPPPPIKPTEESSGIDVSSQNTNRPPPKPEIEVGSGKFYARQAAQKPVSTEGQVTFNFENQPVQAVVKAILGDMLQENYTIAPGVGGNVTYSTSKPISREDAMPVLEMLLAWTGNSLVREGNRYTVMQTKDAIPGKLTPRIGATALPGYALRIYPLRYISPTEMAKLMKPYVKADAIVSADPNRALVVLAGTPAELDNYQRTIDTFDVDWMRGMSIGVFTMQHVDVGKLLPELDMIFGSKGESPLAGMFRFMPIEQTNSIVVITPQPEYLKQAEEWLYRLDRGSAENTPRLYIYEVKNLKAADLAEYLIQIFVPGGGGGARRSSTSGNVAPGLRPTTVGGTSGFGGMNNTNNSLRPQSVQERNAPVQQPGPAGAAGAAQNQKQSDIRISAIDENNQLLVMAQPYEWDQIQTAIRKIDMMPLQVQIEARILEVRLQGALQYGVQWWLGNKQGTDSIAPVGPGQYAKDGNPNNTAPGNLYPNPYHKSGSILGVNPTASLGAPTFSYSFINSKFQMLLNALETSGLTKTLSAPSMVVNNNQEAQLTVGQQFPVVQNFYGATYGSTTTDPTAVNPSNVGSVQYLSTGVTLDVKPRVNPGGLVYLDISQQVSSQVADSSSKNASGNPTISNRQFQTQLAIQSGQTVLLGGLIQDVNTKSKTGVPLISRVPVLGNLFGNTDTSKDRTELIVLITPRVISNSDEARQMTEDYSHQFESLRPLRGKDTQMQANPLRPALQPPVQPSPQPLSQPAPAAQPQPQLRLQPPPQQTPPPAARTASPTPSWPAAQTSPSSPPPRPAPAQTLSQPATQISSRPPTQVSPQPAMQTPTQISSRPPTQIPSQPAMQTPTQISSRPPTQVSPQPSMQTPSQISSRPPTQVSPQPAMQTPSQASSRPSA